VLAYRQFGLDEIVQRAILETYLSQLTPPRPLANQDATGELGALPTCSDPDDQKFLEIASQTGATHLLTRDRALNKLARRRTIRDRFTISTPECFAASILGDRHLQN